MSNSMTLTKILFLGTGISFLSQAAHAEDAGQTTLSTQGTTGAVDINAGVAISEQFTDNVFLTANDRRSDFVTVVAPWVELSVSRENFRFSFEASAELARFADSSSEDYEDFFLGMETRFRINDDIFAFGGLDHAWDHEARNSPDDVNGLDPTEFQETTGFFGIGGTLAGDRSFRLGVNARKLDFDDTPAAGGGLIDNDDRDRVQFEFGGRLGVARTAQGEFFVQGIYDQRDYDDRIDNGGAGFQRSSEGIQAAFGYSGDVGMMRGEVLVGVLSQDYDDPRFDTTTAVDYGANLTWRVGENTQLTGIVERTLEETTLSGASGYLSSTAGLRLRHRVASNISFAGHFFLTENDYQGVPRTDVLTETGVSLRYYINPKVYLDTEYDFLQRQSDVAGVEYDEHRITFRFGTRLEPQFDEPTAVLAKANPWRPYAGFQLGHLGLQTKVDGIRGGGGSLTADFGDTGLSAGIFAGYRTEIGDLSLGFEIGADTSDASWRHGGGRTFTAAREESIDISATTGFRTDQNNLIYGRFGVVASRFDSTYQRDVNPTVRQTDEELGLMAGIGAEVPLGNSMSGRIEYLLRAYDDYNISPTPGGNADNFAHVESLVRFGLVYDFGPGGEPADPPYATDFSGPYAGVQLGHGTLQSDNTGPRPNAAAPNFILDVTRAGQGFTGGVVAGFGHISDRFYVGAEGELELSSANWNIERNPSGRIYSVEKLGTLGASLRAGYVINDSVLVYGRAGVVTSRFNTSYATSGNSVDQDDDLFGVRIGAGVEFALTPNTNIRFDYTQTEYDSHSVDYGGGVDQFDTSERLFRVGVTRQF